MRDAEMVVERLIKRRQALRSLDRDYDEQMSTRGRLKTVPFSDPLSRMITSYLDLGEVIEEHTSAIDESRLAQIQADNEAVQFACIKLQKEQEKRLKEQEKRAQEQRLKRLMAKQQNEKKRLKEKEKRERQQEAERHKRIQFAHDLPHLVLLNFDVDISHVDMSSWVLGKRVRLGALNGLTKRIYTHTAGIEYLVDSWHRWVYVVDYVRSMSERYKHKPHVIERWKQWEDRTRNLMRLRYSKAARMSLEWQERRGETL